MGVNTGVETKVKRFILCNMLVNMFNQYSCVLRIRGEQELPTYCMKTK